MGIIFKRLTLHCFKSHRDLTISEEKFGNIVRITGDNAKGKSSIGDAPAYILFGTDMMGTDKFDPTPLNYEYDYVKAELLVQVDDKLLLLGRGKENGENKFWVNESYKNRQSLSKSSNHSISTKICSYRCGIRFTFHHCIKMNSVRCSSDMLATHQIKKCLKK